MMDLNRRNRRRLSDAETRQRMLRTAVEMIERDGLTVSLEHLSFEAVIRAADVSRDTADGRHALLVELIRRLAEFDQRAILASPAWRTYHALCATVSGLADSELRSRVRTALAEAEQSRIARIAEAWQTLTGLFGYR